MSFSKVCDCIFCETKICDGEFHRNSITYITPMHLLGKIVSYDSALSGTHVDRIESCTMQDFLGALSPMTKGGFEFSAARHGFDVFRSWSTHQIWSWGAPGVVGALLRLLEKPNLIGGRTDKRNASHRAVKIRFPRLVYLSICCLEA